MKWLIRKNSKPMTSRKKIAALVGASLLVLAIAEQFNVINIYYSRSVSSTSNSEAVTERRGDLTSTVQVERSFLRWVPFVKIADTVHRHTHEHAQDSKTVLRRDSTTTTRLVVVGLCSTKTFDALADAPFEREHRDYLKK
jgi:hypothetical protein